MERMMRMRMMSDEEVVSTMDVFVVVDVDLLRRTRRRRRRRNALILSHVFPFELEYQTVT